MCRSISLFLCCRRGARWSAVFLFSLLFSYPSAQLEAQTGAFLKSGCDYRRSLMERRFGTPPPPEGTRSALPPQTFHRLPFVFLPSRWLVQGLNCWLLLAASVVKLLLLLALVGCFWLLLFLAVVGCFWLLLLLAVCLFAVAVVKSFTIGLGIG